MGVKINYDYSEEKHEECGIVAIYSKKGKDVAPLIYKALMALQHRGQDAAGFAIENKGKIDARLGIGLVDRIFEEKDVEVKGSVGIGHTRYPTAGECRMCDVQPFVHKNIAVAHNGHIPNYQELKKSLEESGYSFTSSVDSEVVSYILDKHLKNGLEKAVSKIMEDVDGAYSIVSIVDGKIVVFRDPRGIRPLVWGENDEYICFASESVALDINNIPYVGVVNAGELVTVSEKGSISRKTIRKEQVKHCMFEYVYFSRPDSIINDRSVYQTRKKLGEILAREAPVKADVVIPVPDTSRGAAASYASTLGIPCEEGLIKNRYIGRTFIMPSQEKRVDAVRVKLNPIRDIINGKSVVLVDDSIVRGTTLKEIVMLVRQAGAKKVHIRIPCPPIKAPCFYGVDMSTYEELIANKKTVDQICKFLDADSLQYISIDGLKKAIAQPVCTGCLNEEYHSDFVKNLAKKTKNKA